MAVEACTQATLAEWLGLRGALWPATPAREQRRDACRILAEPQRMAAFLARDAAARASGFAEATLRTDHVIPTAENSDS